MLDFNKHHSFTKYHIINGTKYANSAIKLFQSACETSLYFVRMIFMYI
jgi:hypothetical protein